MDALQKLIACETQARTLLGATKVPPVALVLGSGLGPMSERLEGECVLTYDEIAGFPVSTAPGHVGQFLFGRLAGTPVVLMQGRVHYYEGYPMSDVVLPIRLLGRLGVRAFVLTNACGGIRAGFKPGDLMVLRDHIASFVPSPLTGPNLDELGPRFPDMTEVYDAGLRAVLHDAAAEVAVELHEGVYLQVTGPAFETPIEVRAYEKLGADVTGMSTAVEAMAARHMGLKVAGVSCITNLAAGLNDGPLTSEEVNEMGLVVADKFSALLAAALPGITKAVTA
jgi:purine-nucleoside phosphorylase